MPATEEIDRLIRQLEEDIIFGRLLPRERLLEDVLMQRFAAKRHIVRRALGELERMGIISRAQHKGALVRDFSLREIEELYERRALLQQTAAGRIRLPAPAALLEQLQEIHQRHGQAIESANLRAVYHLNNQFHEILFAACGNTLLAEAIAHYAWLSHAIRSYRIASPVLTTQAHNEHGQMISALENADRDQLVQLCVEHIYPSKEAYMAMRLAQELQQ
jgi:DNA-binding GntR family transcriptional regulator